MKILNDKKAESFLKKSESKVTSHQSVIKVKYF